MGCGWDDRSHMGWMLSNIIAWQIILHPAILDAFQDFLHFFFSFFFPKVSAFFNFSPYFPWFLNDFSHHFPEIFHVPHIFPRFSPNLQRVSHIFPTFSLQFSHIFSTFSLHFPYNFPTFSRISYIFPTFSQHFPYNFPTFSLHFPYIFPTISLQFSHIFSTFSLHFPYNFPTCSRISYIFPTFSQHFPWVCPGSTVPFFGPVVGLLSLVLSFSALAQQLLGAVDSGEKRLDLAADVPGFGAVANWYEEQDHDAWWILWWFFNEMVSFSL